MGYRGKVAEQAKARELRATGMTLLDIAHELGVSKSSVSLWVRDVQFVPGPRRRGCRRAPNALQRRKQAEIDELLEEGRRRIGELSDREFLVAGAALYAGEGTKGDGEVVFANSDPRMMAFFAAWLRRFFPIDESRLRVRIYLHEGLDLDAATAMWSEVTGVPPGQFREGYRASPDPTIRTNKHEFGCAYLRYCSSRTHRSIMGLVAALLSWPSCHPG
jgi:transcriptional regulator with XRE-family HTH domain